MALAVDDYIRRLFMYIHIQKSSSKEVYNDKCPDIASSYKSLLDHPRKSNHLRFPPTSFSTCFAGNMESDPGTEEVRASNMHDTPSSSSGNSTGGGSLTLSGGNDYSIDEHQARMNVEIMELARRYTNQSHNEGSALFPVAVDSKLDPNGQNFDARTWAKAFYGVRVRASEGKALRTTGVAFKNLNTFGFDSTTDFQKSVGNIYIEAYGMVQNVIRPRKRRIDILQDLEGVLCSGEMLAVLGPPGSGCSTFLRVISGETHGFHVSNDSVVNYQGIRPDQMKTAFRGESIYTAEVDDHFAHLTVGDTLYLAARARCPETLPDGVSRHEFALHMRDVTMALFGISHTRNTRVGNDFVRGVSGGERKRVTIAEAALSFAPMQCWDNSTRGLDSANAIEFCRTLRTQADVIGCSSCVAIYQAPQSAYDVS
jgi:ATP-binding cassette, subfamily G (WHITE), member 2, PDR